MLRVAPVILTVWLGLMCGVAGFADPVVIRGDSPPHGDRAVATPRTMAAITDPSAPALPTLRVFASRHYHIHTDLSRSETVPFGRHMDATFAQYERRFAAYADKAPSPMPLYLFREQAGYVAFMRSRGIDAEGSGGMFFVTETAQGLATWAEGRNPDQTLRVLQHEGFHQFAWRYFGPSLPVWMNEGLAQYFEDAVILDRGMELGLADAHRIEVVRRALSGNGIVPLDDLLSLNSDAWAGALRDDRDRAQVLYAQSWSVVYFLIHGDNARYLPSLEVYLRQLAEGRGHRRALDVAFGRGALPALEDRWRLHASRQRPDAVTVAAERLDFLGTALLYKAQRGEPNPRTFQLLCSDLRERHFTLTRSTHNLTRQLDAADPTLFTYTRPGGEVNAFEMLEPSGLGLPPRLCAPGLSPEPTLEWFRRDDGTLGYEVEYR